MEPPPPDASPGGIGVALAIVLGLIASFIQSLGLTIQRKSHIQNEALPAQQRRTEWKRPLWLVGFVVFITANIAGTVFQIGALPIVMLAPLGAVSLLYNALLARILLNDIFSQYMIFGTIFIAGGAVLIGFFGTVPDHPHSLDELLALYARPAFVAFAAIFALIFFGVLGLAHLAEWQLHIRLHRKSLPPKQKKRKSRKDLRRRWSAPTLATLQEVNENPSGIATPILALVDEAARRGLPAERLMIQARGSGLLGPSASSQTTTAPGSVASTRQDKVADYGSIPTRGPSTAPSRQASSSRTASISGNGTDRSARGAQQVQKSLKELEKEKEEEVIVQRTQLGLSVAYGGASGTLSGACLLLAKSGVELLVLTFSGQNQFSRWQSWFLLLIMIIAALAQLWYLNKSLRLSDPTIVCPLAFCFYNTSSIALGLVYFDQVGALRWWKILLVAVGTALLLMGVWIVSLHRRPDSDEEALLDSDHAVQQGGIVPDSPLTSEPEGMSVFSEEPASPTSPVRRRRAPSLSLGMQTLEGIRAQEEAPQTASALYSTFLERGFSVGIAASSPGFHLLPSSSHTSNQNSPVSSLRTKANRRTVSEADMRPFDDDEEALGFSTDTDSSALLDSDAVQDDAAGAADVTESDNSSAFNSRHLPTLDVVSLRQRLGQVQLSSAAGSWLQSLLPSRWTRQEGRESARGPGEDEPLLGGRDPPA